MSASEDLESSLTSDAAAAGSSVGIGAAVAVSVIETFTTANVERDLTAASLTLTADTTSQSDAKALASVKGESDSGKNADDQSKDQVNNNPNTSGKTDGSLPKGKDSTDQGNSQTDSQGGDSDSGSVGIAAAVAVNWSRGTNVAEIGDGTHTPAISATGAVKVSAEDLTSANARAIGAATDLSSDVSIGAGVAINVDDVTNTGSIGAGTSISGGGITVEAITPAGKEDDFIVWGVAAAGGKSDASVAASVGVQVLTLHTIASIGKGAQLSSTEGIAVTAGTKLGLQSLALAGGLSTSGSAVGGAIVVNILPAVQTQALIDSGTSGGTVTRLDAAKAISVTATSSLNPIVPDTSVTKLTLPAITSVAVAGAAGGGDAAVTGSVIVDVFSITTTASIADGAQVNQVAPPSAAQTVEVAAKDDTNVLNVAGALALTTGDAGVGIGIIVDVVNKTVSASVGKSAVVSAGGDVSVKAASTEQFLEIGVDGAASTDAAVTGSVIVVVMNEGSGSPGTYAFIDDGATVNSAGNVIVSASDTADKLQLFSGNVSVGGSAGVGVSAAILVRNGVVDAHIGQHVDIQAWGATGLSVTATQEENITLLAIGGTVGGDAGVAGSVTVDALSDQTYAHIDGGATVNGSNSGAAATESVAVAATDTTTIDGIAGALAVGGSAGIGAGVDVEVVTKDTEAWIAPAAIVNARGDLTVDATSSENVISISVGAGFSGTAAVTVNAGVSVFTITTKAFVDGGASPSDGAVVNVGDTARIAAGELLTLSVIAGNLSASGSAAVGAAGAVPIVSKTTTAFIGDHSTVNALGNGSGLTVQTGAFAVTLTDTRFAPSTAIEGDNQTIDLGYTDGFKDGQQVLYDNGGGADIGGLTGGDAYYVIVVSPHEIKLAPSPGGAPITLSAPVGGGESQRLVPTNQAGVPQSSDDWFNPTTDVSGNTIMLPVHAQRRNRRPGRLQLRRGRADRRPRRRSDLLRERDRPQPDPARGQQGRPGDHAQRRRRDREVPQHREAGRPAFPRRVRGDRLHSRRPVDDRRLQGRRGHRDEQ